MPVTNYSKPRLSRGRYISKASVINGIVNMKADIWGDTPEEVEMKVKQFFVQNGVQELDSCGDGTVERENTI